MLTDAGPLIALADRSEPDHARCVQAAETMHGPLVTTWPAFTEAMYLIGQAGGWRGQEMLWKLYHSGRLVIEPLDRPQIERAAELMEKYRDTPMDLADATLVALAEALGANRIFTLDSDFRVYRLPNRRAFEIIPE